MKAKTSFLLLLIVLVGTFVFLKVQVLGNEQSNFNQTTRYRLGKYTWVRTLLGMHKDGDARAWYLNGKEPIALIVVKPETTSLDGKILNEFADQVSKITGRPVRVFNQDSIKNGTLSNMDLDEIASETRRAYLPGSPDIFVVYTQDFQGNESEVGRTYKEFGLVLSHSRLENITRGAERAMDDYILSTMMHEFGHQLGLDHLDQEDCIMNKEVESPGRVLVFSGSYTPTDFCQQEIDEINRLRARYQ